MVHVIDHPLIKRDLSILRARETPHGVFRATVARLSTLLVYEASRALPILESQIDTPLEATAGYRIDTPVCVVSILRAGLGMVTGVLNHFPDAYEAHLGMYRDEETHKPVPYYKNIPNVIGECHTFLVDPMLATGGSAIEAVNQLKKAGAQNMSFLCLIAAQAGIDKLHSTHPELPIITAALDRELDGNAFIRPGLGDAGDRTFGT